MCKVRYVYLLSGPSAGYGRWVPKWKVGLGFYYNAVQDFRCAGAEGDFYLEELSASFLAYQTAVPGRCLLMKLKL